MIRSMYSGITGLQNHQQKLDVIGNNIANVNTYGFKKKAAIRLKICSVNKYKVQAQVLAVG